MKVLCTAKYWFWYYDKLCRYNISQQVQISLELFQNYFCRVFKPIKKDRPII